MADIRRRLRIWCARRIQRALDVALGIETATPVTYPGLEFGRDRGIDYQASGLVASARLLCAVGKAGGTFVDLGCGKGWVLCLAAMFPFRRIVGVELSPSLADIARQNLRRCRLPRRCRAVEVIVADAGVYTVPPDTTVAYMFNPFGRVPFQHIVGQFAAIAAARGCSVRLIYANPVLHDLVLACGGRVEREAGKVRLYRFDP